ncbi:translocation/assembly module TamB domain-containing protein [Microvirga rosea]|uniref:translocation/assembly module TamB domain-containing protein n=1 Tax=Microvirga rosea TaxID=2715425 RepID=UPI001D0A586E|nr:translocation/assembly module TamB domain-containing protein [Microvirga rosea]MCB8821770.1 translocation/assembly module TamB domain-containing protein [Microvirga rosea]
MRRLLIPTVLLLAGVILLALAPSSRSDEADRGFLSGLISRALSTPTTRVSIGAVEGALSSDATIRNITIADRDGVWLRLDSARLVWRRLALLSRRLEIDRLEIGQLEVLRRPLPSEEPVPDADQPLLPEPPVRIQIQDFALRELSLGQQLLGVPARLTATGSASLGNPSEGLNLRFDARRLDAPGQLIARLLYATENLQLTLSLDEPAGGVLARAANIPGLPPVKLDLAGSGTLDAFNAQLTFDAGPSIGARGQASLRRTGAARLLDIDTKATIEGLLPSPVAPIFAGTTELRAQTSFGDDGTVDISGLSVVSQTARLDASGRVTKDSNVDLSVSARAVPTTEGKTVAGRAEIRKLAFDGKVVGPLASPQVEGKLDAEDARLPAGHLAKLSATFSAKPDGSLSEKTTRIALTADAAASGVTLTDEALAKAVGSEFKLTLRGSAAREGATDVDTARLTTQTVEAIYTGQVGTQNAAGKLSLKAPDLSRFADAASLALKGELNLTASTGGLLSRGPLVAVVDGAATRFATGLSTLDKLVGNRVTLSGGVQTLPNGGLGFRELAVNGHYLNIGLSGDAAPEKVTVSASARLPDLSQADSRLAGRAEIAAQLTGSLAQLNAQANVQLHNATALGRPVSRLSLDAAIKDLTGNPETEAKLSGVIDGKTVEGALHLTRIAEGGWILAPLDLKIGTATIAGQLSLSSNNLAAGRLMIDARNLDDLSPLVLTRLSGDVAATLVLNADGNRQGANLDATGSRLRLPNISIDRFEAKLSTEDLYGKPVIDGSLNVDRAVLSGQEVSQIRFLARGSKSASDITLTAQAYNFDLSTTARLVPDTPVRLELSTLTARRDRRQISLVQPSVLVFVDDAVDVRRLSLAVDRGSLTLNGRVGSNLDLALDARSVPLSAASIFSPGLNISGILDGGAQVRGPLSRPDGNWRLQISDLATPQTRSFGLPATDVAANGQLRNGRTSLAASVRAGSAGTLKISGDLPLSATGDIDLSVQGRLDLNVANNYLSISGRSVTGAVDIDARVTGSTINPLVTGSANLSRGSFTDAEQGIRLSDIRGRVVARGTDIAIEQMTASTRNGGSLTASGRIRIDPAAGFPGDIRISGSRAELASNDIVTTTADLSIFLSGPLAQNPRINGEIRILSMEVSIPERLATTIRPLEGTKHVRPTPTAAARLALAARAKASTRRTTPFNAALDLTVSAPSRIFVRGRGIQAELGGSLRLTGTLADPVAIGAFDLRNGRFTIVGTRLDLTRGRLTFTGDLTPETDFAAETRAGDVTAQVFVTGSAREPRFAFSSDPALPQDEVLSRILFSKASGGLSVGQAVQLAQVAAQFAGGGGDDVFETLRRSLGVEGLDLSFGADGGPTIGISKALSDRISVGVRAGASAEQSGVSVDIDVTRRIRVQGEVGANGNTSVGIGAEWEY